MMNIWLKILTLSVLLGTFSACGVQGDFDLAGSLDGDMGGIGDGPGGGAQPSLGDMGADHEGPVPSEDEGDDSFKNFVSSAEEPEEPDPEEPETGFQDYQL